jgi:hypothetical protein
MLLMDSLFFVMCVLEKFIVLICFMRGRIMFLVEVKMLVFFFFFFF